MLPKISRVDQFDGTTVLMFSAPWCQVCPGLERKLKRWETQGALGASYVAKVDIEETPALAVQYSVQSVPTVIVLDNNGTVRGHFPQAPSRGQLAALL